jgi:Domain of Unknown Function (DUF928)
MSIARILALISLPLAATLFPLPVSSQDKPPAPPPNQQTQVASTAPVYKPPLRGAPRGRIGGGTRGIGLDSLVVSVLAPDHSGLTTREQPSLYWVISSPTTLAVELTLTDPRTTQPVLEVKLPGPTRAGLQRIRLDEYGVRLEPGVPYRWYVAVIPDTGRRSKDILAGGIIERVEPTADLRDRLARARPEELASVYAEEGFWYDALAVSSELIERSPGEGSLRQQRTALLSQVGLPDPRE